MAELEDEINAVYEQACGVAGFAMRMLRGRGYQTSSETIKRVWQKAEKSILTTEEFLEHKIKEYHACDKYKRDPALIAREISMQMRPYYSVQDDTVKRHMNEMGLTSVYGGGSGGAKNVGSKIASRLARIAREKRKEARKLYRFDMLPEAIG